MYAKQSHSQGRRTPLSLNAGGAAGPAAVALNNKQHHDQQQHHHHQQQQHQQSYNQKGKSTAATNGSNGSNMSAKSEKNATQHKTEPTLAELKKQHMLEKKQQQQLQQQQLQQQQQLINNESNKKSLEKNDEKRTQNGNSNKNATNGKDKQAQNGNNNHSNNDIVTEKKKEKLEKVVEKQHEKLEKVEKNGRAAKEDKKEKATDNNLNPKEVEKEKKSDAKPEKTKNDKDKMDTSNGDGHNAGVVTPVKANGEKEKKNVTPNKSIEKPQKSTPPIKEKSDLSATAAAPAVTTTNDVEMEPLQLDNSPIKFTQIEVTAVSGVIPAATSTPGKVPTAKRSTNAKSEIQLALQAGGSPDRSNCPRTFTQISGRRSIRPLNEFAPTQYRESYRRINTELDVTSTTNTSLNVTVGSEVPNNSSFSFFGRGRKRDRTPPSQSTMELHNDVEVSPPKKVRLDMHGFFSAVASPLTLLRSRFSKASIQSSTPVKLNLKADTTEDVGEVQNVSGISIHEEIPTIASEAEEVTATEDITVGNKSGGDFEVLKNAITPENNEPAEEVDAKQMDMNSELDKSAPSIDAADTDDIQIKETPIVDGDPLAKNKRCHIM